jgi:hypothetical protein
MSVERLQFLIGAIQHIPVGILFEARDLMGDRVREYGASFRNLSPSIALKRKFLAVDLTVSSL